MGIARLLSVNGFVAVIPGSEDDQGQAGLVVVRSGVMGLGVDRFSQTYAELAVLAAVEPGLPSPDEAAVAQGWAVAGSGEQGGGVTGRRQQWRREGCGGESGAQGEQEGEGMHLAWWEVDIWMALGMDGLKRGEVCSGTRGALKLELIASSLLEVSL